MTIVEKFAKAEKDWMLGQVASVEEAMGWTEAEVEAYRTNGTLPVDTATDISTPKIAQTPVPAEPASVPKQDTTPDTNPALTGFLAGVSVELEPWQRELVEGMMTPDPQPDQPPVPEAFDVTTASSKWAEAVQARPAVLTMGEAMALELEDFTLIDAAGPKPSISAMEYVHVGDQLTIEWDGQGGLERFTGRVIQLEGLRRDGDVFEKEWPWVYLKGRDHTYVRTPMEGVRIVAHLLYQNGGAFQTSQPALIRDQEHPSNG